MRVTAKKYSVITKAKVGRLVRRRAVTAARTIRRTGNDWARKWNTGQLDEVVAADEVVEVLCLHTVLRPQNAKPSRSDCVVGVGHLRYGSKTGSDG